MDTDTDTDSAARIVSDLVAALEQAWNEADGTRFAAGFSDDADFIDIRGSHHRGREPIGHGHQELFGSIYSGSTVRYSVLSADAINTDCVLGIVRGTLDAPDGPLRGVHESTMSVLAVNENGAWKIRAFHNTLVAEA